MIDLDDFPVAVGRDSWKTKEGWSEFVNERLVPPSRLTTAQLRDMSDRERADYTWERLNFMINGRIVHTPYVAQIASVLYERIRLNAFKRSGKLGVIVAGAPNSGKTTTATRLAKDFQMRRQQRAQSGAGSGLGSVPVIYVCAPSDCTPKALLAEMLHFLGVPIPSRMSAPERMNVLATCVAAAGTELIIIDEIHNLADDRIGNRDSSDYLKQLSEKCPATFMYVGTDNGVAKLLSGERSAQVTSRFRTVLLEPYKKRTQAERDEWTVFLESLEGNTGLVRQKPGDIVANSDLLFEISGGRVGDVVELVQTSAMRAMQNGTEKLDFRDLRAGRDTLARIASRTALKRAASDARA